jgi:hypothetical protein
MCFHNQSINGHSQKKVVQGKRNEINTNNVGKLCVTTLALGLQPRQWFAKVQTESETQESHFILT